MGSTIRRRCVNAKHDCLQHFTGGENLLNWHQFAQFGDIFGATIYDTRVYALSDPDCAEHILRRNWQNYVKGQAIKRVALLLGSGLMVSEGALWKRERRMVQPAFHPEAVAGLWHMIIETNATLLGMWESAARSGQKIDVTADVSQTILKIVLRSIFGPDYDSVAPEFEVVSSESARNLQFAHSFGSLGQIIRNVVVQRRSTHAIVPDILGMLMGSRDRESARGMSEAQIVNEIKTLIVAGHETTASTLNWLWYLLSQHAAIEDKLSDELDVISLDEAQGQDALSRLIYTRQVIEETLRLYPAGWLLTRKAIKDDSLGPYFVPAGTEVYIPMYFIQRYPGHWPDPDRFSADRSASRHALAMLPFSARPRNCIGESLARIEMQAHIMLIAKRLRLQIADSKAPELDIGVNLRSKHNFVMRPNLRPAPSTDYLQHPADAYQLRSLAGRTTSPPALH